jgi:hypothetical protein
MYMLLHQNITTVCTRGLSAVAGACPGLCQECRHTTSAGWGCRHVGNGMWVNSKTPVADRRQVEYRLQGGQRAPLPLPHNLVDLQ